MDEEQWRWILPVLLLTLTRKVDGAFEATQIVDMESSQCDQLSSFQLDDSDIVLLKANPPQLPGGTATRDKCTVSLRTTANRRFKVYISDVVITDCGARMEIFDGSGFMNVPALVLRCGNTLKKYDSRSENIKFSFVKQSAAYLSYRFNIVITTDQGPDIDFERATMAYDSSVLAPGVIVGIAIAGVIIFIALLAIFIYCAVKQRKKNLDAEKAPPQPTVYTSENSKVMFPGKKNRYSGSYESGSDSHNSSYSSADGHNTYVNMNPDPKGRRSKPRGGYDNRAYASSEDGTHDRSRDSTGSDDIGSGVVNGSFESGSDAPSGRRYVSKNQENGQGNSSISRSARSGSARKTRNRKNSGSDGGTSSQRSRSRSGHRSGHRDSGRRSRSHGDRGGSGGSQRRSRSRSPHSQSSNHSAYDSKGHNRMYDVSSMAKRSREGSNSSTSSRDEEERNVSHNPGGRREDRSRSRGRQYTVEQDQYGSQV